MISKWIPFTRAKLPSNVISYLGRELMGILSLIAVAAFDIGISPVNGEARAPLIALHLLFLICYLVPDFLHMVWQRPINGHHALALFVTIQLLMIVAGSNPTTQIVLLFVMSAYAHETLDEFAANVWITAFGVASVIGFSLLWQNPLMGIFMGVGALGGYLFIGSAARNRRVAEAARADSQRLLQELQTAHEQLQRHAHEAEVLAAAEERNRLARELHDTLGHRLTVAAVQLEGAQRLIGRDANKASQMVGIVRGQVLDGLTELRQTVAALRTPLEADLALPAAIQRLANQYAAATGLPVQVQIDERVQPYLEQLNRGARHTLFRAAQEGLTNIQKHANASAAWITLELRQEPETLQENAPTIHLTIHDNGRGPNGASKTGSFGLAGLSERAAQVNGTMHLQASPYGGTALSLILPLEPLRPSPATETAG